MLGNKKMRLGEADKHLRLLMAGKLQDARHRLSEYDRLPMLMDNKLTTVRHTLSVSAARLEGLSPLLKLSQGYSLTEDAKGRVISSVASVKKGDFVRVNVKDGHIDATVDTVVSGKKVTDGGENS